jgi:HSP20 family protein
MTLTKTSNGNMPSIGNLLSDLFDTDSFFNDTNFRRSWMPSVNVIEDDKCYELDFAVPGLKKDDFKIEVDRGVLSISAESKSEKEETDKKYTRKEYNYSSFSRSFTLPDNVNEDQLQAKYEDGVLKVVLTKKEEEKSNKKTIKIN